MLEVTKMAISKKLLTVLAGLVLMTVLLLQCDLDAQAANHNYLSDYTGDDSSSIRCQVYQYIKGIERNSKGIKLRP